VVVGYARFWSGLILLPFCCWLHVVSLRCLHGMDRKSVVRRLGFISPSLSAGFAVPGGQCVPNSPMRPAYRPRRSQHSEVLNGVAAPLTACSAGLHPHGDVPSLFWLLRSAIRQRGRCLGERERHVMTRTVLYVAWRISVVLVCYVVDYMSLCRLVC
jgi:hypothetical protein